MHLVDAVAGAYADDPEFWYCFIAGAARDHGREVSDRTVCNRTSRDGVWSVFAEKRGEDGKKAGPRVFDCDFTATALNELWLVDSIEHRTRRGKLRLCAVKGVFSNRVPGRRVLDQRSHEVPTRRPRGRERRRDAR